LVLIVVGLSSLLANIGELRYLFYYYEGKYVLPSDLIILIPGFLFILEGILIKLVFNRRKINSYNRKVNQT